MEPRTGEDWEPGVRQLPSVMALFQSPDNAERAVAELSLNGFTERDVSVVVFSAVPGSNPGRHGLFGFLQRGGLLGDTIDRSDGVSVMDGTSVGATFGGILGLVYGTRFVFGPISLGTLGMLLGGLVGFVIDRLIPEKRRDQLETSLIAGLVLVQVDSPVGARVEAAKRVLKGHHPKQMADLPGHDQGLSE